MIQYFSLAAGRLAGHWRIPLYRNAYLLTLSAALTSVLGLAYWAAAARLYTPENVGINSAAISLMTLLAGIAQFNLRGALIRFIPRAGRNTRKLVVGSYVVSTVAAVVVGVALLGAMNIWPPLQKILFAGSITPAAAVWFVLATVGWCIFTLQDQVLTGLRQTQWVPLENALFAVFKLVLLVLLAAAWPGYGIFASWTIVVAMTLIPVNGFILFKLIPQHIKASINSGVGQSVTVRELSRYVAGDYLGAIFSLLSFTLLPIMVTGIAGASANAYFYLPWTIYSALRLFGINLTTSLTVEAALDERQLAGYTRRVIAQSLRIVGPMMVALLLGAEVLLLVFGKTYAAEGVWLLRLLAVALVPDFIVNLYIGIARVQRKVRGIVVAQAAACLLTLALSYALLPQYGIVSVGAAWTFSLTVVAAVLFVRFLRPMLRQPRTPVVETAS